MVGPIIATLNRCPKTTQKILKARIPWTQLISSADLFGGWIVNKRFAFVYTENAVSKGFFLEESEIGYLI